MLCWSCHPITSQQNNQPTAYNNSLLLTKHAYDQQPNFTVLMDLTPSPGQLQGGQEESTLQDKRYPYWINLQFD